MSPKIVNKDVKKKMIMETAIKIFAQKGYFQTTISEIAKEAGIGKGTIYEYFISKEEIIQNAINLVMDSWKEKIPLLYGISDLKDLLNILKEELKNSEFRNIITILIEVFLYSLRNPDKKEDISFFVKMSEEHDNLFTSIIENIKNNGGFGNKDIDIVKISKIIHTFFDGIFISVLMFPEEKDNLFETANYFIDILTTRHQKKY